MGFIYMIENNINHRKYVGQTTKHKLNRRVSKTLNSHTRDIPKMLVDVKRYGVENFTVTTLKICENYLLDYWEKWFIVLYNCIENGYNTDLGGYRGFHTNGNVCKICGKSFRSKSHRTRDKYCSDECRRLSYKLRRKRITKTCLQCGSLYETYPSKKDTSHFCSRRCQHEYNKTRMKGNSFSKGKCNGGKNGRAKKCMCVETGKLYDCAKDASRELGLKSNGVLAVCNGRQKTAKGYHFIWC